MTSCKENVAPTPIDITPPTVDPGLETPEDPLAPFVSEEEISWIQEHHEPVSSLSADEYSDLQFLKPLLENKRIVQLGESGHGVRQYNQAKTRLIKFLHEEMGYNVLAFESGMYECFFTQKNLVKNSSSRELMRNSIFAVWSTDEVEELFTYIAETQTTDRPIILAGFDVQFSSVSGSEERGTFFYDLIVGIDSAYAKSIQLLDNNYRQKNFGNYDALLKDINVNRERLITRYTKLAEYLTVNQAEIIQKYSGDPIEVSLGIQLANSIIYHINRHYWASEGDNIKPINARDEGMARNVSFLVNTFYPEEKMIIWAHNFHIRHANSQIPSQNASNHIVMGEWVHEEFSDELYTIGFYAYTGRMAHNNREIYSLNEPGLGSLESIMYRTRRKYAFLDLENQSPEKGNGWIFRLTEAKSWGKNRLKMILHDNYDGIFFIHTVSPPNYL
ncbi:MAG: erythromycin esterase family protein [Bacteroidota bacterium]